MKPQKREHLRLRFFYIRIHDFYFKQLNFSFIEGFGVSFINQMKLFKFTLKVALVVCGFMGTSISYASSDCSDWVAKKLNNASENQVLVSLNEEFPSLKSGTLHSKAAREVGKHYPARQINGPISWSIAYPQYHPTEFTAYWIKEASWSDPQDPLAARELRKNKKFESYEGVVLFSDDNLTPRNPRGRTGIVGRGTLQRWGANFAVDPIVTRINPQTHKFEMVAILREDTRQWAIPGGFVEPGEVISKTLAREFAEEALGKEGNPIEVAEFQEKLEKMMNSAGMPVYAGYVDDIRNTDNAWMETKAFHLHLEGQEAKINLVAGDDAKESQWMVVDEKNINLLYANHGDFVKRAIQLWSKKNQLVVLKDGSIAKF